MLTTKQTTNYKLFVKLWAESRLGEVLNLKCTAAKKGNNINWLAIP